MMKTPNYVSDFYNLKEIQTHAEFGLNKVKETLDRGEFHPEDASVYMNLKPSEYVKVKGYMDRVSVPKLCREYLSGDVNGGGNLIPDLIYRRLYTAAAVTDVAPLASTIVTPESGSSLKVDIEVDGQFQAKAVSGGGSAPVETMEFIQATATPVLFNIAPAITNELIEDSQFELLDLHLRRAGEEMGEYSTHIFMRDALAGTDGDGTQNTLSTGAANVTDLGDLLDAYCLNLEDTFVSDTVIIGPGPVSDILQDVSVAIYSDQFHTRWTGNPVLQNPGIHQLGTYLGMNVYVVAERRTTGDGAMYLSSKWHSLVMNKENSMLTVRRRWLKMENYSDPVRDLVGMVVSSRQDQISVYNDSICEITES